MSISTARCSSHAIVSPGSLTRRICCILRSRSCGASGIVPLQFRRNLATCSSGAHPEQPLHIRREIHVKKSIILAAIAATALGLGSAAVLAQGQGGGGGGGGRGGNQA